MSENSTRLSAFCDKVLEMGWLLAVIVTPLFFNVYSSRVFEPDKLTTLRTLALIMAAVWLVKFIEERVHGQKEIGISWQTPLVYPTLFTVAVYLISTVLSVAPSTSFFGSYQRLQGTYTTLAYIVVFLVILQGMRTRAQRERLISVVIINSLPIALYGLIQRNKLDPLPWGGDVTRRVASNMGNAIFVAAYMIMAAPPTLSRIVNAFRAILNDEDTGAADMLRAAAYIFIFMVQLISIWYTQSRGPLVGLLAGLGVWVLLGMLALRRSLKRRTWRGMWAGTLTVVTLFVVGFLMVNLYPPLNEWAVEQSWGRVARVLQYEGGTGMVRNLIWQGGLDMILPHEPIEYPLTEAHPQGHRDPFNAMRPLVGYGPETMYVAYNSFYPPLLGHYESRTASPDRSHNETLDSLIITGLLGFVAYVWLFGGIFAFALRQLGVLPDDWRRKLFFALLIGGAIVAVAIVIPLIGPHFFCLAIPIGMVGGLAIYLVVYGFSEWGAEDVPEINPRFVLITGLLSAIVAHFVEINFGIAIAATRTTFWAYAGILVLVGTGTLSERDEAAARRKRASGKRRKSQGVELPLWLKPVLASGLLGGFMLGTLAFDFITNAERLSQPMTIIWRALTILPAQGSRTSYGALMIFAFTWVMSAVVFVAQMAKRGVFRERLDDWWLGALLYALTSLSVGFLFAGVQAGRQASLVRFQAQSLEDVLQVADHIAGVMTAYYIFIFITMVVGGVVLLLGTRQTGSVGQVSLIAMLVLVVLAIAFSVTTNLHPIQADIIYKQAQPYERQGQWLVAIEHYKRAIDRASVLGLHEEDFYYLYLGRAYLEYAKRLDDKATQKVVMRETEKTLTKAREVNPLNTDHSANLARMYRTWTGIASDADRRRELIQLSSENYEIATMLSPQNAILWNEWAMLYLSTGNFEEAQEKIDYSLNMDEDFEQSWTIQADIYANQKMITDAVEAYHEALEISPKEVDVWLRLGDIYRNQKKLEKAAEAYEEALELRPNRTQVWRVLGSIYAQSGQLNQAIDALQEALARAPESNDAWDTHRMLAIVYNQAGDSEAALKHAQQALQLAPEDQQQGMQQLVAQLQGTGE